MDEISLERLRANDHNEWFRLYEKFDGPVKAYLCRKGSDLSEAEREDIYVETFTKLGDALYKVEDTERLRKTIFTIALRTLCDHIRGRNALKRKPDASFEGAENDRLEESIPDTAKVMENYERDDLAMEFLNSLGERDRTVLRMVYYEDRDLVECSEKFGLSPTNGSRLLEQTLTRARKFLLHTPHGKNILESAECACIDHE